MKDLIKIILGPEDSNQLQAFIIFTILGMILIKAWRYNMKLKISLKSNPQFHLKFDFSYWLKANLLDFILAFLTSFLMFRLFPDMFSFLSTKFEIPEFVDKMTYGLLLGIFFQFLSHKLNNLLEKLSFKKNEK